MTFCDIPKLTSVGLRKFRVQRLLCFVGGAIIYTNRLISILADCEDEYRIDRQRKLGCKQKYMTPDYLSLKSVIQCGKEIPLFEVIMLYWISIVQH